MEHATQPDAHAFAAADGLLGLLQPLFQRSKLRYRRQQRRVSDYELINNQIVLQALESRDKLGDSRPTQRRQQYGEEFFLNLQYFEAVPRRL